MAQKHKKHINSDDLEHKLVSQTIQSANLVFSKQSAKFCNSAFKKDAKKAAAIRNAMTLLAQSIVHGDSAIVDGKKLELKIMTAGGLSKYRGRQLSINVGNDRIRVVICRDGNRMFVSRGFVKKDDGKDYIRHCEEAKETIKSYLSNGVCTEFEAVFKSTDEDLSNKNTTKLKVG